MPSVILAAGATAATSTEQVLAAGEEANLIMSSGSAGGSNVVVQIKDAAGGWVPVVWLEWKGQRATYLRGPLTFRVERAAQPGTLAGVDRA